MTFLPGQGGRKKGALGTLRKHVKERADELGIDPIEILLLFASGDWKKLGYTEEKYISGGNEWGIYHKYTIDPAIRCKAAADAAQYLYPKLKSIEYTQNNVLLDMTSEQKLEAMRHGVAALELEVELAKNGKKRKK